MKLRWYDSVLTGCDKQFMVMSLSPATFAAGAVAGLRSPSDGHVIYSGFISLLRGFLRRVALVILGNLSRRNLVQGSIDVLLVCYRL